MPIFEYYCEKCEIIFEDTLTLKSEIEEFRESHPCPQCNELAVRDKVTTLNFKFAAPPGPTAGTGVHGQSGVHDLDYPRLDKAVGRSADLKWANFSRQKAARDQIRRQAGTNSLSVDRSGQATPTDPALMKIREKSMTLFKKSQKS